ncbi:MAG: aminoacyltransferase [Bacteroidales bacterium]|jgi:lipid II:glycine glycyltransferase (peptidoglycan interpeptide bridge formation enzyme)|nr:aminoacyltransferase [Bacteroidales bacterium]
MIEIINATKFIENFQSVTNKKVYRVKFPYNNNPYSALLMVKAKGKMISLPYFCQGIVETSPLNYDIETLPKNYEIRDTSPHSNFSYTDKVIFTISPLSYKYPSNVKRKVNKSISNNVRVIYGESPSLLRDFYKVYSKRMHKKGVPFVSIKHIEKLIKTNCTKLFVAYYNNKPIGGATLNIISEKFFENEFFATLSSFNHFYPSYALHNSMIIYSKENGANTYSLSRTTKNSSVYKYKKHFKAEEIQLYWSSNKKERNIRNNKFLFSLYKLIPYFIAKRIGNIIHKRIY